MGASRSIGAMSASIQCPEVVSFVCCSCRMQPVFGWLKYVVLLPFEFYFRLGPPVVTGLPLVSLPPVIQLLCSHYGVFYYCLGCILVCELQVVVVF